MWRGLQDLPLMSKGADHEHRPEDENETAHSSV
jgi:hypothetical protein